MPLADDTLPLPTVEEPAPVGIAPPWPSPVELSGVLASGSAGGGSGPGGYPPGPVAVAARAAPTRMGPMKPREAIADPASQCRWATRNNATTTAPKTTTTTTTQIHSGPTMALLLCLVGARRHDPGTSTASGRSPG
jgi:hypothetical protein